MSRWLALGLFFLLPLQATWFALLVTPLGLWQLLRSRRAYLGWAFVVFALGGLGQLFSSQAFVPLPPPPDFVSLSASKTPANPISPLLHELSGWNAKDGSRREARPVDQGFWRIPRYNSQTHQEYSEFLTWRWFPVEEGKTYTQSFYLRHDGNLASLYVTFFTHQGHHPVSSQKEQVAPGVWRVWASYTVQPGDGALRAIDIINAGGDFSYLEIGWPQLEVGSTPTPYRLGETGLKSLVWRLQWWVGAALMGFLVLQAGLGLFRALHPQHAGVALLLGLIGHLVYVAWQWDAQGVSRAGGLIIGSPNFLGHGAVALAGLVWALTGRRLGGLALLLAFLLVWFSGSRTAFAGLLLLGAAWSWGLGRWRWLALGLAALLIGLAWKETEWLGRLSQFAVDNNVQARWQFWQAAWQAAQAYPLGGVGFGNFALYFDLNPPPGVIEYSPGHVHNLFLQVLAEGGVLALLGLLGWLLGLLWVLWRAKAASAGVVLLAVLLLNLTDFSLFFAWVYYPLVLTMAQGLAGKAAPVHPNEAKLPQELPPGVRG